MGSLWLLLPLATWLVGYVTLVRPARRQLAQAQQVLLAAEKEELAAQMMVARDEELHERMRRELSEQKDTAERMRAAEREAHAQLNSAQVRRPSWILPGLPARHA